MIKPRVRANIEGLEWTGPVPMDWQVRRLGVFFSERRQKVSDRDYAPLSVTMKGVVPQLENVAKTDDGDNRKRVCAGDFVINSRSDRKGAGGVSPLNGSVSLINIVLEPAGGMHIRFAAYLLTSYPFQEEFYRVGKGIVADMWTTKYSDMRNIRVAVPGEEEQISIACHLDRETARIDGLIAKKTRFIELLREKGQALTTHAITKGLDASVSMKDTGVEWLGKVPGHWRVARGSVALIECRLKNDPLFSQNYLSLMANKGIIPYEEKGNVGNKKPDDLTKCKIVEKGDFVINSMNYAIGSYGVSPFDGVVSPVYVVMKHRQGEIDPKFMDLILSNASYQNYAQSLGTGILDHRRAIGWDDIKIIPVPIPPISWDPLESTCRHASLSIL